MELYVLLMKEELFQNIDEIELKVNDENKGVTWVNYLEVGILLSAGHFFFFFTFL